MTIRRNCDIASINRTYSDFLYGAEGAPVGTFTRAKEIMEFIADIATDFLAIGKDVHELRLCNSDGIREIEVLLFDNVYRSAEEADRKEVAKAVCLGNLLTSSDKYTEKEILARVERDGDLWLTRAEWEATGMMPEMAGQAA